MRDQISDYCDKAFHVWFVDVSKKNEQLSQTSSKNLFLRLIGLLLKAVCSSVQFVAESINPSIFFSKNTRIQAVLSSELLQVVAISLKREKGFFSRVSQRPCWGWLFGQLPDTSILYSYLWNLDACKYCKILIPIPFIHATNLTAEIFVNEAIVQIFWNYSHFFGATQQLVAFDNLISKRSRSTLKFTNPPTNYQRFIILLFIFRSITTNPL